MPTFFRITAVDGFTGKLTLTASQDPPLFDTSARYRASGTLADGRQINYWNTGPQDFGGDIPNMKIVGYDVLLPLLPSLRYAEPVYVIGPQRLYPDNDGDYTKPDPYDNGGLPQNVVPLELVDPDPVVCTLIINGVTVRCFERPQKCIRINKA